jgi:hypothetical protein
MSEFEKIQNLIRLKRHEMPDESFTEDFLIAFHQRQRRDLLQGSARSLLWERIRTYVEDLISPKWAYLGVGAAAAVAITFLAIKPKVGTNASVADAQPIVQLPPQTESPPVNASKSVASTSVPKDQFGVELPFIGFAPEGVDIEPLLISRHFAGGYGDESMHAMTSDSLATDLISVPFENGPDAIVSDESR